MVVVLRYFKLSEEIAYWEAFEESLSFLSVDLIVSLVEFAKKVDDFCCLVAQGFDLLLESVQIFQVLGVEDDLLEAAGLVFQSRHQVIHLVIINFSAFAHSYLHLVASLSTFVCLTAFLVEQQLNSCSRCYSVSHTIYLTKFLDSRVLSKAR